MNKGAISTGENQDAFILGKEGGKDCVHWLYPRGSIFSCATIGTEVGVVTGKKNKSTY